MRPFPYRFSEHAVVLGHYSVAQRSGAIAATPAAGDDWARIKWSPSTSGANLVLTRLRVSVTVITAVTAAVQRVIQASIARSYTVDHSAAITVVSMAGDSGKMHKNVNTSLMTTNGPGICTTAPMTGQTLTLDAAPFAMVSLPPLSPTLGAAAVTEQVGAGCEMQTLYDWTTMVGYPPTLSSGEGIVVENLLTGHATGTVAFNIEWSWAEVINPFGNG